MKLWTLLLACLLAFPFTARAEDAEKMLAEFEALKRPKLDVSRRDDPDYVKSLMAEQKAFNEKRADFARDFYDKFPTHPRAMSLMTQRWQILVAQQKSDVVKAETDKMLADNPGEAKRADILFARAAAMIMGLRISSEGAAAVDEFIKAAPKDQRGAQLLFQMAMREEDPAKKSALNKRIVDEFPNTDGAKMAQGQLRLTDAIGKPFDLAFTDAISGKEIKMADLKGKVVVVDFWATWCGPCVAEMPKMKELYAEYKDKGVEFIGVSLDEPGDGLQKLKDFVAKNEITWPQYYQGKAWSSEFSSSWGINSIPCVFVVDTEGKLYSTQARGKLKEIIPKLLNVSARS
jgi:thiol-disulfide isomerase/thioredoxin